MMRYVKINLKLHVLQYLTGACSRRVTHEIRSSSGVFRIMDCRVLKACEREKEGRITSQPKSCWPWRRRCRGINLRFSFAGCAIRTTHSWPDRRLSQSPQRSYTQELKKDLLDESYAYRLGGDAVGTWSCCCDSPRCTENKQADEEHLWRCSGC